MNDWSELIAEHGKLPYFRALGEFVSAQRTAGNVFPPHDEVFSALHHTPLRDTRVVILGQDPYHGHGQAHGLAFSVRRGTPVPPSLRNVLRERESDLAMPAPSHGDLTAWAQRGVLLLNTTLTVREGEAGSHAGQGWETFTDAVIERVNELGHRVVFVLWGSHARRKRALVTGRQHMVIESAHPSPLSAHRGFLGSRPFSRVNAALTDAGAEPVDWSLPD